jgi:DNA-binding NarL/FixJ family response regulator
VSKPDARTLKEVQSLADCRFPGIFFRPNDNMTAPRQARLPRLVLADDHRLVAEALRAALSTRFLIAGVVSGGTELLALLRQTPCDVVLLDLEMPGRNGLDLIPVIRREHPALWIIMLTMMADPRMAQAALDAGARGFVPKEVPMVELITAIERVFEGNIYLSPRIPKTSHRVGLDARHALLHRLTPRQEQILLLLGEGQAACEVGRALQLSPSTVTFHKHNIMRILGIETESALVRYAVLMRAGSDGKKLAFAR